MEAIFTWQNGGFRCVAKFAAHLPSGGMNIREGYHALPLLIPQLQSRALEAVSNSKGYCLLEDGFRCVAIWQVVVRNAAIKVMYVVKADVAGEPLQNTR